MKRHEFIEHLAHKTPTDVFLATWTMVCGNDDEPDEPDKLAIICKAEQQEVCFTVDNNEQGIEQAVGLLCLLYG